MAPVLSTSTWRFTRHPHSLLERNRVSTCALNALSAWTVSSHSRTFHISDGEDADDYLVAELTVLKDDPTARDDLDKACHTAGVVREFCPPA